MRSIHFTTPKVYFLGNAAVLSVALKMLWIFYSNLPTAKLTRINVILEFTILDAGSWQRLKTFEARHAQALIILRAREAGKVDKDSGRRPARCLKL